MSSNSDSESDAHQDDLLRIYTQLMLDSLDSAVPTSTLTPSRDVAEVALNKADGMNAKKRKLEKKKLKREETKRVKADLVEEADFRLLSRQPVRTISLLPPKEEIRIVSNPRHVPWTDEKLAARRNRIRSTVVDGKDLLRTKTSNGHLKVNLRVIYHRSIQDITKLEGPPIYQQPVSTNIFHAETTPCLPPLPALLHAERPKTSFSPYVLKRDTIPARVKPNRVAASSAHHVTIPTLTSPWPCDSTVPQPTFPQTRADQRRHSREIGKLIRRQERLGIRTYSTSMSGKTRRVNFRPEASFWAPPVGLGGKARGYAYGYAGSREGAREEGAGWARDRMRVGCMAEVEEVEDVRRGKSKVKGKGQR